MPFNDLVHPDDRQMVFDRYIQRLEGKDVPSRYRFRFVDARGNTRWADMSVALISWEGKPASLCLAADITELKQAEEALKRSEEKYRYLFERASEGILVARGVTLEFVNPALERILGYPLEKITSEPFINFIYPDDQAMVVDHHLRRMRGESVETGYDFRIIASDGTVKWLTITSQVIGWEGALANLSFIADITARKKAEEELRIFMESVENSSDAVGMSTPEGKHYYQNQAFDELFGPVGENPQESVYVDPAVGHEVFRAIMAGGQWTGEVQMYAKDRRILEILLRAYANKDKSGRITALVGIHTDITERKRAEDALNESEDRFSRAIAGTGAGLWDWDIVNDRVYFSPQWKTMLGYEDHEVEDAFSGWKNLWHPEDAATLKRPSMTISRGRRRFTRSSIACATRTAVGIGYSPVATSTGTRREGRSDGWEPISTSPIASGGGGTVRRTGSFLRVCRCQSVRHGDG